MKIESQHTPTPNYSISKPWQIKLTSSHDYIAITYWDNDCTGMILEIRNPNEYQVKAIQEMVRAVNAHDVLVKACRLMADSLKDAGYGVPQIAYDALTKAEGK
jgi:hypothetical protein